MVLYCSGSVDVCCREQTPREMLFVLKRHYVKRIRAKEQLERKDKKVALLVSKILGKSSCEQGLWRTEGSTLIMVSSVLPAECWARRRAQERLGNDSGGGDGITLVLYNGVVLRNDAQGAIK